MNRKLIIGSLPHENKPNKYSSNDIFYTKAATGWFAIYWIMKFEKIYINNMTNNNNLLIYIFFDWNNRGLKLVHLIIEEFPYVKKIFKINKYFYCIIFKYKYI